jgi:hypothetical protein
MLRQDAGLAIMQNRNPFDPPRAHIGDSDSSVDSGRPPIQRPPTIERAFWLILGSASLGFLTYLARGMHESPLIMTLVMGYMVGAAFLIRSGQNWARIVFLILLALGSLGILLRVAGGQFLPAYVAIFALQTAIKGYATWLTFSLPGRQWFSRDRKVRS